jgi:hypothetical protein
LAGWPTAGLITVRVFVFVAGAGAGEDIMLACWVAEHWRNADRLAMSEARLGRAPAAAG